MQYCESDELAGFFLMPGSILAMLIVTVNLLAVYFRSATVITMSLSSEDRRGSCYQQPCRKKALYCSTSVLTNLRGTSTKPILGVKVTSCFFHQSFGAYRHLLP